MIETVGVNFMGDTYSIREAVLTPERNVRGLLTDADKYDPEQQIKRSPLSEEEKETICTLYQDDVSVADIAGYTRRSVDMVRRVLDQKGLRKRVPKGRAWTDEERKTIVRMWHQGYSMQAIGAAVDRTWKAVSQEIHSMRKRQAL